VQLAASGIDRRHLQGRCGVSRVWRRCSPLRDTTSRSACLPPSGAGAVVRSGKKGACPSIARPPPGREGRRDEGSTVGDNDATTRESACRAPGSRKVESILVAATALLFAGDAETGAWIGRRAEGTPTFRSKRRPMTRGARYASEEGTSCLPSRDRTRRAVEDLLSDRIGPHSQPVTASPTLGATDGGFAAPLRTRRHDERWPPSLHLSAVLHGPEDGGGGTSVARCSPSPRKGGGPSQAVRLERAVRGAGANASARAETPQRRSGRGSDARGRARASSQSLQKSTDSDRRREANAIHFTRFGWRSGTGA